MTGPTFNGTAAEAGLRRALRKAGADGERARGILSGTFCDHVVPSVVSLVPLAEASALLEAAYAAHPFVERVFGPDRLGERVIVLPCPTTGKKERLDRSSLVGRLDGDSIRITGRVRANALGDACVVEIEGGLPSPRLAVVPLDLSGVARATGASPAAITVLFEDAPLPRALTVAHDERDARGLFEEAWTRKQFVGAVLAAHSARRTLAEVRRRAIGGGRLDDAQLIAHELTPIEIELDFVLVALRQIEQGQAPPSDGQALVTSATRALSKALRLRYRLDAAMAARTVADAAQPDVPLPDAMTADVLLGTDWMAEAMLAQRLGFWEASR